jgi:hypothetical protein
MKKIKNIDCCMSVSVVIQYYMESTYFLGGAVTNNMRKGDAFVISNALSQRTNY